MYEGIVQELIDELGRLPGIGPKSAQRIAFHIVQTRGFDVSRLGELLLEDHALTDEACCLAILAEGEEPVSPDFAPSPAVAAQISALVEQNGPHGLACTRCRKVYGHHWREAIMDRLPSDVNLIAHHMMSK